MAQESIDQRYIVVGPQEYTPSTKKPAGDAYRFHLDFTTWLIGYTSTDTLASGAAAITGSGGTAPTAGTVTVVDTNRGLQVLISGGTAGWKGTVAITGTTTAGQIKRQRISVEIV
jgi:hypothetical protein